MEKMVSYVFGNIENHEKAIGVIAKTLSNQFKFNKTVAFFAVTTTACLYLTNKKIDKLTKEVEELKKTKGE